MTLGINDPTDFQGTPPMPTFVAGERMSADKLNTMQTAERNRREKFAHPRMIDPIAVPDDAGVGTITKQFRILSIGWGDFLVCRPLDGSLLDGDNVIVVKPWLLRRTRWDGSTRNGISFSYTTAQRRVATRATPLQTENQMVIPRYLAGDTIYASRPITGDFDTIDLASFTDLVIWLDDNRDSRAWAKAPT